MLLSAKLLMIGFDFLDLSIDSLFHRFQFASPQFNYIFSPLFSGISVNLLASVAILGALGLFCILAFNRTRREYFRQFTFYFIVWIFLANVGIQLMDQYAYLDHNWKFLINETIEQKYRRIFADTFAFAEFCLAHADSSQSTGRLITGFSTETALEPYVVKYFLYPHINVIDPVSDPRYLIILRKEEPLKLVPSDYEVLGIFGTKSLIARRK
jgi:hypothetical protein